MSSVLRAIEPSDRSPFEGWSRAVLASLALLISALTTQIVRVSWFGGSAQPLSSRPMSAWRAVPSTALAGDSAQAMGVVHALEQSAFSDTARRILGAPSRPIGLVGMSGRAERHIGEYVRSRDSVALAPTAILSEAQLKHAYLHELSHHWMARHPELGKRLLAEMPPLTDSSRYGFGDPDEQAAEALAHAVQFWRATRTGADSANRGRMLDAYESVMPGTRLAYLSLIESGSLPIGDLSL